MPIITDFHHYPTSFAIHHTSAGSGHHHNPTAFDCTSQVGTEVAAKKAEISKLEKEIQRLKTEHGKTKTSSKQAILECKQARSGRERAPLDNDTPTDESMDVNVLLLRRRNQVTSFL